MENLCSKFSYNIPNTFSLIISLKEKGADEGPSTGLDIFEKRKVSFSCQEIKSWFFGDPAHGIVMIVWAPCLQQKKSCVNICIFYFHIHLCTLDMWTKRSLYLKLFIPAYWRSWATWILP